MSKRSYKSEFLKYGFTCIRTQGVEKPQCVMCFQVLSNESLKENKVKRHFDSCHSNLKKNVDFFQRKESALKSKGSTTQVKMNPFSLLHLTLFRV